MTSKYTQAVRALLTTVGDARADSMKSLIEFEFGDDSDMSSVIAAYKKYDAVLDVATKVITDMFDDFEAAL